MSEISQSNENCWIPIRTFISHYKWPTESAMRSYAYKAKKSGLKPAFLRVGRRLLVNPRKFFDLIQQINEQTDYEKKTLLP